MEAAVFGLYHINPIFSVVLRGRCLLDVEYRSLTARGRWARLRWAFAAGRGLDGRGRKPALGARWSWSFLGVAYAFFSKTALDRLAPT